MQCQIGCFDRIHMFSRDCIWLSMLIPYCAAAIHSSLRPAPDLLRRVSQLSHVNGATGGSNIPSPPGRHVALEVERLAANRRWLIRSPAPPSWVRESVAVPLSKTPHPDCSWRAGCRLAWFTPPSVCECVNVWMNGCKSIWIKASAKSK